MRAKFDSVDHSLFQYSMAKGLFFDGNEAYIVEVYEGGKTDELGVKLYNSEETLTDVVYGQPGIDGVGVNESLSISSERAELPESDEELEAFARYVLQDDVDEGLEYLGSRDLEDLDY